MLNSVEKLNHFFTGILNLVYIHFLWILFTLMGLGIFGIGPSTYALTSICRQWIQGKHPPVFKTYWMFYKENFKESVLVSWIYLIMGYVIIVDLMYVSNWYIRAALFVISFIYLVSLVYIFPIMAHYNWKGSFLKIKMSFLFGVSYLQYTLVLLLSLVLLYWAAISFFPGILTFFGVSFLFYCSTWTALQVFARMEALNTDEVEDKKIYYFTKENRDETNKGVEVS